MTLDLGPVMAAVAFGASMFTFGFTVGRVFERWDKHD